jgi:hypothetical protein
MDEPGERSAAERLVRAVWARRTWIVVAAVLLTTAVWQGTLRV